MTTADKMLNRSTLTLLIVGALAVVGGVVAYLMLYTGDGIGKTGITGKDQPIIQFPKN